MSLNIQQNYPLKSYNTFGLDCRCRFFTSYDKLDDLKLLLSDEYLHELPWVHIGVGSNLLFLDDYPGLIISSALKGIAVVEQTDEKVIVEVASGEIWDEVVAYAVEQGWHGIENLSHIPGQVGAAAVQNIGAYGVELADRLLAVQVIDTLSREVEWMATEQCQYGYRQSIFKEDYVGRKIVTAIRLQLSLEAAFQLDYGALRQELKADATPTLEQVRQAIIAIRSKKLPDPLTVGNAGSFFKNPVLSMVQFEALKSQYPEIPSYAAPEGRKVPAAWLIEQCGWKGHRCEAVGVWPEQPLVLVNYGGASGDQIAQLAQRITDSVADRFDVALHPEVRYI